VVLLGLVVVLCVTPTIAEAMLMLKSAMQVPPCGFQANYTWNPVASGDTELYPPPNAPEILKAWKAIIGTVDNANKNNINVTADIIHDTGADCADKNDKAISLKLTDVKPTTKASVLSLVTAGEVLHPTKKELNAVDVGLLKTTVLTDSKGNPLPSSIVVAGMHAGNFPVVASFTNDSTKLIKTLTVTPDYTVHNLSTGKDSSKDGDLMNVTLPGGLKLDQSVNNIPLPPEPPGNGFPEPDLDLGELVFLTSYRIVATGSPATDTELAFLGLVDGSPGELNLGAALDMLLGQHDFLTPNLRPVVGEDTLPLYVGIDLTQWVGLAGTFDRGEIFSLSNGTSSALPGFLVGTSPITLGPNGYETADPYSGDVVATGTIDGRVVPEPPTLALLALGLLSLSVVECLLRAGSGRCRPLCPNDVARPLRFDVVQRSEMMSPSNPGGCRPS